jgi:alkylation response protein AidB-like acyl-CoA dehydrogenase
VSLLEYHNLSERERKFVTMADDLAASHRSRADVFDRQNELPLESYRELKASGYASLTVPERFGGLGASLLEFVLAHTRLAMGDASVALGAAMNAHVLGSAYEAQSWPENLLEHIGHEVVSRGALINAIASEPELGSPSRGGAFRTLAHKVEGGWEITGRKTWATGGEMMDYFVVHASLEGEHTGTGKMIVPATSNGFRLESTWTDALAMRSSAAHDAVFENVFVPEKLFIPPAPIGNASDPNSSAWFWSSMAATYLGVGWAALEEMTRYAKSRVPSALGKPISSLEGVQRNIGEMELSLKSAQLLLLEAAGRWSTNTEVNTAANTEVNTANRASLLPSLAGAKHACTNAAIHVTDLALRTAGGGSLTRATSLERHFRDARAGLAHPPSDDLALGLIGRARLG